MYPKLLCGLIFGLLAACESLGPSRGGNPERDFLTYGASIQAASESSRREMHGAAVNEHRSNPTAGSAIRLALASLAVEDSLPSQEIVSLLAFAEASAVDDSAIEFLQFFRPLVERLVAQQITISNETATRQALEAQLEALKELEEQLDVSGAGR